MNVARVSTLALSWEAKDAGLAVKFIDEEKNKN